MSKPTNVTPIITEPEILADARMWERADQDALFEACLAVVNSGIRSAPQGAVFLRDPRPESDGYAEITVTTWRTGGAGWKQTVDFLYGRVKLARQSRKHRKQVQTEMLNEAAKAETAK